MKTLTTALISTCLALGVSATFAQDAMKKDDAMPKTGMMKKEMTATECKEHMAMAKKDGMMKDGAMMKKDAMCADMMKKEDAMMKKDAEPMKK